MIYLCIALILIVTLLIIDIADCVTTDAEDHSYEHQLELDKENKK